MYPWITSTLLTGLGAALFLIGLVTFIVQRYYPGYVTWLEKYYHIRLHTWLQQQVFVPILRLPDQAISADLYYLLCAIAIGTALSLGFLTYSILQGGIATTWNLPIYHFMRQLRSMDLDIFLITITLVNSLVTTIFWLVITAYLIAKKDVWRATHWIILGAFVAMVTSGLKFSTAIPRPGAIFPIQDAFPSAHVVTNMTLFGTLLFFFHLHEGVSSWMRWFAYCLYAIWISLITFSRLYLAAHWLTDIIGAILLSSMSMALFSLSYYQKKAPPPNRRELALITLGAFSAICLVRFVIEYERVLKFYMASF